MRLLHFLLNHVRVFFAEFPDRVRVPLKGSLRDRSLEPSALFLLVPISVILDNDVSSKVS
jgi:hypothetical protein